ncbi:hypothetical protein [Cupriavidus sp. GA3-3]|uniref:hypothetical protein n=1 Tax=Cupriavidus TaxID=106589 RepID=UPI003529583E
MRQSNGPRNARQLEAATSQARVAHAPQDLRPVLELVVEDLRRVASGKPIQLDLPDQPAPSWIEPDAFAIVVRNLVEKCAQARCARETGGDCAVGTPERSA